MPYNDRRALTLLVFHALRKAVESFDRDAEPKDSQIQEALITVISLLPRMGAVDSDTTGKIYLQWLPSSEEASSKQHGKELIDIQPVIDSIRVVWQDYVKLLDRADAS